MSVGAIDQIGSFRHAKTQTGCTTHHVVSCNPKIRAVSVQLFKRLVDEGQALPWEEGCITSEQRQRLGCFLEPIRELLQRNPSARSTVGRFHTELNDRLGE